MGALRAPPGLRPLPGTPPSGMRPQTPVFHTSHDPYTRMGAGILQWHAYASAGRGGLSHGVSVRAKGVVPKGNNWKSRAQYPFPPNYEPNRC
jgi:hypothetical protein